MSGYRYLTFDCYGTLVDWRKGIENSLKSAFRGVPLGGAALLGAYVEAEAEEEKGYKKYEDVLKGTTRRLAGTLGFDWDEGSAAEFASSPPTWPVFADSATVLRSLGRAGYRRYVLSNVDTWMLRETLQNWGLEVDGFVTAEETMSYKPDPGHWTTLTKRTGAPKEETLHVAQSIFHDIIPAQSMGISTVWVNRYREQLPSGAFPTYIAESLEDVERVLGSGDKA